MFAVERRNAIMKYLKENGSITVEELADKLEVSNMTIRRDLKYLEDANLVARTFGGAILKDSLIEEVPYYEKTEIRIEQKKKLAEYAVSLIKEGDAIILDAGTTNMEIAKIIKDMKNLTVITTDLMIAAYLINSKDINIFCTGGEIHKSTGTCIGTNALDFLNKINVDIAFIGASSIDVEKGMTTPTFEKAKIKRQIIDSAETSILVSDSSKFGKKSFVKVSSLKELNMIITDDKIDKDILEEIKKHQINIKVVEL
jgi:DeoR/GlpR family transcriptional regulator of sugar metabolism